MESRLNVSRFSSNMTIKLVMCAAEYDGLSSGRYILFSLICLAGQPNPQVLATLPRLKNHNGCRGGPAAAGPGSAEAESGTARTSNPGILKRTLNLGGSLIEIKRHVVPFCICISYLYLYYMKGACGSTPYPCITQRRHVGLLHIPFKYEQGRMPGNLQISACEPLRQRHEVWSGRIDLYSKSSESILGLKVKVRGSRVSLV